MRSDPSSISVRDRRVVFSGREQSAFAFPTYQGDMRPQTWTDDWWFVPPDNACAARVVSLRPVPGPGNHPAAVTVRGGIVKIPVWPWRRERPRDGHVR